MARTFAPMSQACLEQPPLTMGRRSTVETPGPLSVICGGERMGGSKDSCGVSLSCQFLLDLPRLC